MLHPVATKFEYGTLQVSGHQSRGQASNRKKKEMKMYTKSSYMPAF